MLVQECNVVMVKFDSSYEDDGLGIDPILSRLKTTHAAIQISELQKFPEESNLGSPNTSIPFLRLRIKRNEGLFTSICLPCCFPNLQ